MSGGGIGGGASASPEIDPTGSGGEYFDRYTGLLHHLSGSQHAGGNTYRPPSIADAYLPTPSGVDADALPYSSRAAASVFGARGSSVEARESVQEIAALQAWNLELRRDVNTLTNAVATERRARQELAELVRSLAATLQTVIAKTGLKIIVPAVITASAAAASNGNGAGAGAGAPLTISEALHPIATGGGSGSGIYGGTNGGSAAPAVLLQPLSPHQQQRTRTVFASPLKTHTSPLKFNGTGSGSGGAGTGTGSGSNSEYLPASADPSLAAQLQYISHAPLTAPIHISERKSLNRKQPALDPRIKYAPPRPVVTASNKPGAGGVGTESDADSELELAVTTDEPVVRTLIGDLVAKCRRCGVRFNTNRTGNYDCAYHSGRLHKSSGRYECCGVIAPLTVMEKSDRPIFCKFGPHIS